eukprot:30456-Eustigmatos_ZCMA.PRE.1
MHCAASAPRAIWPVGTAIWAEASQPQRYRFSRRILAALMVQRHAYSSMRLAGCRCVIDQQCGAGGDVREGRVERAE